MVVYPNAKINLGLYVENKSEDGFHNIETVFFPISLADILEIIPTQNGKTTFESTGLQIDGNPQDNLCYRAYELVRQDYEIPPVSIHLHKIIPMGSGLGGGSSDAAFTVKLLNDLFELAVPPEKMKEYTRRLGSDCTFFIDNKPSFAYGRGDLLEPVQLDLSEYIIAVIIPPVHVNTKEAYEMIDKSREGLTFNFLSDVHKACHLINIIESGPGSWSSLVLNQFEAPVFARYPELADIKQKMYDLGAVYSSMSGSGSAVYGIFRDDPDLSSFGGYFTWKGRPV